MISRSFTWIDDSIEHSDHDHARASALAKKWSELQTREENKRFQRQCRTEDEYYYDPFDDCECAYCMSRNHHCDELGKDECCSLCEHPTELTECSERAKWEREQAERQAEVDLEIELIEDKLEAIGARMMRPYEHWNEDERYMEWSERDRD